MMPTARGMSQMIPSHVLRVGQTIRLEPGVQETTLRQHAALTEPGADLDLDVSLENLNQLILELDPTFQPIEVNRSPSCLSPSADAWDAAASRLPPAPGGRPPRSLPIGIPSGSAGRPSPSYGGVSCSPHGALVFCSSPAAALPPLPGGREARRAASPRPEHGGLRLSHSNRNSTASLLSTSTCSDTSYMLGSSLSLTGEDADSQDFRLSRCSFSDGSRTPESRPGPDKPRPLRRAQRSPASLSGSLSDIPILLVNGELQPDRQQWSPEPEEEHLGPSVLSVSSPNPPSPSHRFQAHFSGSQPSMKFVMDTSKFWFRPHINRAQAEALVQEKEAGAFVMRDSTSHRGSFGLAMKVDQAAANASASASPGESSADLVRHFLIESSAKGVRVKGSSQEPYFGSLSALVYQHTISAYALPCKLLLHSRDVGAAEESATHKPASEDKSRTACNFVYLNAVATEMLTGPCAVQRAVGATLEAPGGFMPTIVNLKVSLKGVTLTDINRKLFFRRHYPAHLLSYGGEDPANRLWMKGSSVGARMFGFVAKGVEAGMENVCHVFAEYERLQSCNEVIQVIQAAIAKP